MSLLDDFARVSRSRPCPICAHGDWCLVSRDSETDPSKVICARVESRRRFGQAGWLHVLRDDGKRWNGVRHRVVRLSAPAPDVALATLAERFRGNLSVWPLPHLAEDLGVSVDSLERLGVGWSGASWSFPMLDAEGRVVGISLRRPDGSKYAVKGGHHGLFVPSGLIQGRRLVICEGQSDTAACLDLGFQAIGRAGARSTLRIACDVVRRLHPTDVVVFGDRDDAGIQGADDLSAALAVRCPVVRLILPPEGIKDAREWKERGATAADIEAVVEAAPVVKLEVRVLRPGVRS